MGFRGYMNPLKLFVKVCKHMHMCFFSEEGGSISFDQIFHGICDSRKITESLPWGDTGQGDLKRRTGTCLNKWHRETRHYWTTEHNERFDPSSSSPTLCSWTESSWTTPLSNAPFYPPPWGIRRGFKLHRQMSDHLSLQRFMEERKNFIASWGNRLIQISSRQRNQAIQNNNIKKKKNQQQFPYLSPDQVPELCTGSW